MADPRRSKRVAESRASKRTCIQKQPQVTDDKLAPVLSNVLGFVDEVCAVRRVCKAWNACRVMRRSLNLRGLTAKAVAATLSACVAKHVKSVTLVYCTVNTTVMNLLAAMTNLVEVHLNHSNITAEMLKLIKHLELKHVTMRDCTQMSAQSIQNLNPKLEILDLAMNSMLSHEANVYLLALTKLRSADFSFCGNGGTLALENLAKLPDLRSLRIRHWWAVVSFAPVAAMPNLHFLDLANCTQLSDADMHQVCQAPNLETLVLGRHPSLTGAGIAHLGNVLKLKSLTVTCCEAVPLTDLASVLQKLTRLQEFKIDTDRGGIDELALHLPPSVTSLSFAYCKNMSDSALAFVGARLPGLQELDLTGCVAVTDHGIAHLATLRQLRKLNLQDCDAVTNAGLKFVGQITSLQWLSLVRCKVSAPGLKFVVGLAELLHLNLSECSKVENAALVHLAKLAKLETLTLQGCTRVSQKGLCLIPHVFVTGKKRNAAILRE